LPSALEPISTSFWLDTDSIRMTSRIRARQAGENTDADEDD